MYTIRNPNIDRTKQIAQIIVVHKTIPSTRQTNTQQKQTSKRTCPAFVKKEKYFIFRRSVILIR